MKETKLVRRERMTLEAVNENDGPKVLDHHVMVIPKANGDVTVAVRGASSSYLTGWVDINVVHATDTDLEGIRVLPTRLIRRLTALWIWHRDINGISSDWAIDLPSWIQRAMQIPKLHELTDVSILNILSTSATDKEIRAHVEYLTSSPDDVEFSKAAWWASVWRWLFS